MSIVDPHYGVIVAPSIMRVKGVWASHAGGRVLVVSNFWLAELVCSSIEAELPLRYNEDCSEDCSARVQ
jgi:hypothetical protein